MIRIHQTISISTFICIYHKNPPNVGKLHLYMDPMGPMGPNPKS